MGRWKPALWVVSVSLAAVCAARWGFVLPPPFGVIVEGLAYYPTKLTLASISAALPWILSLTGRLSTVAVCWGVITGSFFWYAGRYARKRPLRLAAFWIVLNISIGLGLSLAGGLIAGYPGLAMVESTIGIQVPSSARLVNSESQSSYLHAEVEVPTQEMDVMISALPRADWKMCTGRERLRQELVNIDKDSSWSDPTYGSIRMRRELRTSTDSARVLSRALGDGKDIRIFIPDRDGERSRLFIYARFYSDPH